MSDQVDDGDINGSMMDYQTVKCGYGKLIWPDASTFEGFWINGQACGVGVFRSSTGDVFEGFWQQDQQTSLSVFRQGDSEMLDTPGDGSNLGSSKLYTK